MCTYPSDRSPILLLLDWLTLLVALNVMYERDKSCRDLIDDDDKTAADSCRRSRSSNRYGRYAFPSVGVGGGSVARHFKIL